MVGALFDFSRLYIGQFFANFEMALLIKSAFQDGKNTRCGKRVSTCMSDIVSSKKTRVYYVMDDLPFLKSSLRGGPCACAYLVLMGLGDSCRYFGRVSDVGRLIHVDLTADFILG